MEPNQIQEYRVAISIKIVREWQQMVALDTTKVHIAATTSSPNSFLAMQAGSPIEEEEDNMPDKN